MEFRAKMNQAIGKQTVVVFESSAAVADALCEPLRRQGMTIIRAMNTASLLPTVVGCTLVVLGPSVVHVSNVVELAESIRCVSPGAAMVVVTSESSEDLAIAALRAGVNAYLKYPLMTGELGDSVRRCAPPVGRASGEQPHGVEDAFTIIGESAAMREVRHRLTRMAASNSNILITGETGTGKELVAEQMHKDSPRRNHPFVTLNCAAIPDGLLESELFGYERGAFTGANSRQEGKIKAADGGSVFLDEIGEMSPYGQAKLLRMIEGKEIQRLGRNGGIAVDVRIIAATNQDLEEMVHEGKFRKDLFFRLNVARIHLPPLRERKEDLALLIQHYIRHFNRIFAAQVERLSDDAMAILAMHDWPGNVRELKNIVEAIFVELPHSEERVAELPLLFRQRFERAVSSEGDEKDRMIWALSITNWNKSKAASKLCWSRMTLYRKMARYKIEQGGAGDRAEVRSKLHGTETVTSPGTVI